MNRVPSEPSARVLSAIERHRRRVWAICYRMTGERAEADDLAQESMARAIERAGQLTDEDATGWLLRLTTRLCLDHLRHRRVVRRLTELVDPVAVDELPLGDPGPEHAAILRDDLRFAVVVALQKLSPRQRAVFILHDVCDRSLAEVALVMDSNPNATKALLHRARVTLADAQRHRPGEERRLERLLP
jgi:RNA polymerase sigma-70 factor (ECF subfamily)